MVTINSKNSSYEDIGTFFDVPKGSSAVFNTEGDRLRGVHKMVVERDSSPIEKLSELLVKLDIKDDVKKLEAFSEIVKEVQGTPKEGLLQRIKASRFLAVLGIADPLFSVLASAVSLAVELQK